MPEAIPCDIEHVTDFDENPLVYIRREEDNGVIEVRGLENIVVLSFDECRWLQLLEQVDTIAKLLVEFPDGG